MVAVDVVGRVGHSPRSYVPPAPVSRWPTATPRRLGSEPRMRPPAAADWGRVDGDPPIGPDPDTAACDGDRRADLPRGGRNIAVGRRRSRSGRSRRPEPATPAAGSRAGVPPARLAMGRRRIPTAHRVAAGLARATGTIARSRTRGPAAHGAPTLGVESHRGPMVPRGSSRVRHATHPGARRTRRRLARTPPLPTQPRGGRCGGGVPSSRRRSAASRSETTPATCAGAANDDGRAGPHRGRSGDRRAGPAVDSRGPRADGPRGRACCRGHIRRAGDRSAPPRWMAARPGEADPRRESRRGSDGVSSVAGGDPSRARRRSCVRDLRVDLPAGAAGRPDATGDRADLGFATGVGCVGSPVAAGGRADPVA